MKLFTLLVACVAVTGATNLRFRTREPAAVGKTVEAALATIEKAIAANKKREAEVDELCPKEIAETKKWIDAGSGIDNKDRLAAKKQLAEALEGRVKGLKKFLGKLKNIRKRLRSHVIRVNSAFGTKYTENDNAMNAAKSAVDPQAGLKLLKLPAQDVETAEDKAEMAEDDANPTQFLEMDMEEPSKITQIAQKLYDVAMANSAQTRKNIEKERSTLGAFRDKLRALILKREAKLKKLQKQLADIRKALETNESFAKDVFPYLKKHYDVTQESCGMMKKSFGAAEKAEAEVAEAIRNGPSAPKSEDPAVPIEAVPDALKPIDGAAAEPKF
jgi:hypothetical protein